jgi:hypothetical protein
MGISRLDVVIPTSKYMAILATILLPGNLWQVRRPDINDVLQCSTKHIDGAVCFKHPSMMLVTARLQSNKAAMRTMPVEECMAGMDVDNAGSCCPCGGWCYLLLPNPRYKETGSVGCQCLNMTIQTAIQ